MCTYFVLNKYYYIIILYGGSHASDILHVLMGVSVAKLIIYNIVLLFICHNKRSSSYQGRFDGGPEEVQLILVAWQVGKPNGIHFVTYCPRLMVAGYDIYC